MGDLSNAFGTNQRADIGLQRELGDQQRQVDQSYRLAELAQLQAMGQLDGATPWDVMTGRQVNHTTTMSGN